MHPKRVDAVNDPNYSYWHSASFSNDGTKVVFTDEWGGGLGARCRANDPNKWGADAIFNLKDDKLTFANYYKLPAAQGDTENCVAHNGSLFPVPGRDIEVQAWYQGGISVMDFTDTAHPFEIAYFDRGPIDPKMLVLGGDWSAYWYNGNIYASEIARGLDIFELTPTKDLTQNEIDAAKTVKVAELNVQNQQKIEWPAKLVVAKAYLDQLARSQALPADQIANLQKAIQRRRSFALEQRQSGEPAEDGAVGGEERRHGEDSGGRRATACAGEDSGASGRLGGLLYAAVRGRTRRTRRLFSQSMKTLFKLVLVFLVLYLCGVAGSFFGGVVGAIWRQPFTRARTQSP